MSVEQHGPLPLSNFMPGRNDPSDGAPVKIDSIVLHTMVGWISGADARFHNASAQVSAHFGVRVDGSLWQWVQVWDTAYHAGLFYENLRSIGIEHEDGGDYNGVRPDALYARSAALVAQFCKEYGIPCVRGTGGPGIYDHRDILKVMGSGTATACPDALDTNRIIREAAAILNVPAPVIVPPVDATVLHASPAPVDVLHEWAALYKVEGPRAGIRPDIALAQALHETGRFTFPHDVPAAYNNPAGLGATGGNGVGAVFPTKLAGVTAHLQHLLWYFAPTAHLDTPYCSPLIDTRHTTRINPANGHDFGPHKSLPNDLHQLDGHWAVPGVGYADSILALVPEAAALLAS